MQASKIIAPSAAAVVLFGGAVLVAQQASQPQTPVFRSGVEVVTIDVGVVDRQGQPMRGLAASDFVVTVNGQRRRVATAEFMDVAAERASAAGNPDLVPVSTNVGAAQGRLFVFIVDQNTLEHGQVRYVARAASRFLEGLSTADRSALLLMPSGPNVDFTWAHDRVYAGLQRVVGTGDQSTALEFGSLTEARDIANHNMGALRSIGMRECSAGGNNPRTSPAAPTPPPTTGGTQGGTGGSGTPPGGGRGGGAGSSGGGGEIGGGGSLGSGGGGFGADSCTREVQMRAASVWHSAHMNSLASVARLRQILAALARVEGDKTVILISGGWPLEDREQSSLLSMVAADATAARATVHSMFVPINPQSVTRRSISTSPINDQWLYSQPLDMLAGMSGGASYRVDVAAEAAFERLSREVAGYYRIGVERDPGDGEGKARRMSVQVSRGGATVRAREMFDVRTFEDQNSIARLAAAIDAPIAASGIPLRVTSYVAADPDDTVRLKLVLAGEAYRVDPGEATFRVAVRDMAGTKILTGEQPIGEPTGEGLAFSANLPLMPGKYIVRVAVMDGAGRVGSVDHRVDIQQTSLGPVFATGPMLVRVPGGPDASPRIAVNAVRQDEQLAIQLDLEGERAKLEAAGVTFEIAATADGPSLVSADATLSPDTAGTFVLAQAVTDTRVLPPGSYIARAKVSSGGEQVGVLRRGFNVTEVPAAATEAAAAPTPTAAAAPPREITRAVTPALPAARVVLPVPRFTLDQALAPGVLGPFLDRVAARPDAASPMIKELVNRARSGGIQTVPVSDTLAAEYPVAAFLRGLSLLSQNKLDPAANAFRAAMRAASDFYPAMVYLGVCYAAGGKDKEAAGAWRTALIKEGDTLPLHVLLVDALMRQDRADLALQTLTSARTRWPADDGLKRRFVLASLLAGQRAEGLTSLDELVTSRADDEPTLMAGLMVLYKAFSDGRPVDEPERDRARMVRLADAYRARSGPAQALVDTWMAEVTRKR
jgi:VWFA-related protein